MHFEPLEDSILIDRANHGSQLALDQLIQKHMARAYQYAHRLTRNAEEAGDIVADAFVRVVKGLSHFKGNAAFTSWLYRIESNCFLDSRKRKSGRPNLSLDTGRDEGGEPAAIDVVYGGVSAHEKIETDERMKTLKDAVAALPDHYRTPVVMFHMEDLSYEEIAEILRMPLGTVKSRLNRARLALKEMLTDNATLSQSTPGVPPGLPRRAELIHAA